MIVCNRKYKEMCVLMLLTRQHQSQVAKVEGPGQAVGHVHLPPLADVWHLHLRRTLYTDHRNSQRDVTTPHLCSGHLWEGVRQEKRAPLHPCCPFLCGTTIFLDSYTQAWAGLEQGALFGIIKQFFEDSAMVILADEDILFSSLFLIRNCHINYNQLMLQEAFLYRDCSVWSVLLLC